MSDQSSVSHPAKPTQAQIRYEQLQYSGPIPHPGILEHYNKILPGAAERILKMAEEQAEHRRMLEKQALATDSRNSTLGVISALIITLSILAIAAYSIYLALPWVAAIISAIGITSLVGTFIYGTRSRRQERENRYK